MEIKYYKKKIKKKHYSLFLLGGDIGGTNTNLGIFGVRKNKPIPLLSLHFKSKQLNSLVPAIKETLKYTKKEHNIEIKNACIGAAGVISADRTFCNITNLKWNIDTKEIVKKTNLKSLFLINDFEAIGYGINLLDLKNKNDILKVRHKTNAHKGLTKTKAIIGAGTGLGKSILVYSPDYDAYIPITSEGGHGDFPVQNDFELKLINSIRKRMKIKGLVSNEKIVSGKGIENIYMFIRSLKKYKETKYTKKIDKSSQKAELISKFRKSDNTCMETFKLFSKYYARCSKNFVLDTLALGGLYIAGGIAAKNREIFNTKEFIQEFENSDKLPHILKNIPIYIIVNYNVSLYGAAFAALTRQDLQ